MGLSGNFVLVPLLAGHSAGLGPSVLLLSGHAPLLLVICAFGLLELLLDEDALHFPVGGDYGLLLVVITAGVLICCSISSSSHLLFASPISGYCCEFRWYCWLGMVLVSDTGAHFFLSTWRWCSLILREMLEVPGGCVRSSLLLCLLEYFLDATGESRWVPTNPREEMLAPFMFAAGYLGPWLVASTGLFAAGSWTFLSYLLSKFSGAVAGLVVGRVPFLLVAGLPHGPWSTGCSCQVFILCCFFSVPEISRRHCWLVLTFISLVAVFRMLLVPFDAVVLACGGNLFHPHVPGLSWLSPAAAFLCGAGCWCFLR